MLGLLPLLVIVSNAVMNVGIQISTSGLSLFWRYVSEVEWLYYKVILCLISLGATVLFSTMAAPFYIVTNSAEGFQFLHKKF